MLLELVKLILTRFYSKTKMKTQNKVETCLTTTPVIQQPHYCNPNLKTLTCFIISKTTLIQLPRYYKKDNLKQGQCYKTGLLRER